jgi:hypothetical protein
MEKLSFNPYRGEISKIFFINRDNEWEIKRGRFVGKTIVEMILEFGWDNVNEFLLECLDHPECLGIEKIQILEIINEIKDSKPQIRLKF